MKWKKRTLDEIASMICGGQGNSTVGEQYFEYRSSSYLTRFFNDADTEFVHRGESRVRWVSDVLEQILSEPHTAPHSPPPSFIRIIQTLMDTADAVNEGAERDGALKRLNVSLQREGFEAFYAPDRKCYLRHNGSGVIAAIAASPHRPFSKEELHRHELLATYLDKISEDDLINEVLLPLLRQLGFHRITPAGHSDKSLEYGKDIWMRYTLPTQHILYFGIQVKRGKLDASGASKGSNSNVAEILNQTTMMLGHEIFDPETSRKVLVDHAFIVAGGEITKAARNWLGGKLDQSKRSQIMFMDRDDILNLFIVNSLPLPANSLPRSQKNTLDDEMPF